MKWKITGKKRFVVEDEQRATSVYTEIWHYSDTGTDLVLVGKDKRGG